MANHALGRHQQFVPVSGISIHARCSFFINEFYVWTVTFVKISLACMLLRIQPAKIWRIGLFTIVGILVTYALACSLWSITCSAIQCEPIGISAIPATIACRSRCSATGCMAVLVRGWLRALLTNPTDWHSILRPYRCNLFAPSDHPSVPHRYPVTRQDGGLHPHGPRDSRQLRCCPKVHQPTPLGHQL